MGKNRLCAIQTILAFCIVLVSLLAVGCFHFQPLTPPAEISGRVIISQKVESNTPMPTPPSGYVFWIVKLSINNLAYKYPIEVSSEAFRNGTGWNTAQRNTNYQTYVFASSEPVSLATSQSGQFTALFVVPSALAVGDYQIIYQGQEPSSYATLTLEDKVAAYDWDTKTVTSKMPSHDNLVLATLFGFLLAAVRWYPDLRRIIRRDRALKSETRIMETSLDKKLNHPILGILVIVIVGLLIYYLYPSIGYKAVLAALVVAVAYIGVRRMRNSIINAKIREMSSLEDKEMISAEGRGRIEQGKRLIWAILFSAIPAIPLFALMSIFYGGVLLYWVLSAYALILIVSNTRVWTTKGPYVEDVSERLWLLVWILGMVVFPPFSRFLYHSIGSLGILVQIMVSVPVWYVIMERRARVQALGRAKYEAELEERRKLDEQLRQSRRDSTIDISEFEDYYWQLPVYGLGEEGIKTSEFAEIIGEDSKVARRILESWRALGRARIMPSGREYKWWRTET